VWVGAAQNYYCVRVGAAQNYYCTWVGAGQNYIIARGLARVKTIMGAGDGALAI
jgi:photosystem II stability/assembly factor-like uncharacterized protein